MPPLWSHRWALKLNTFRREGLESTRNVIRHIQLRAGPVNTGRVIWRLQTNLNEITSHCKHVWYFCWVWIAGLGINTMNHIDTGSKRAADTRFPLWRTWLLDTGSDNFAHPAIRGNHCSFAQNYAQSCYDMQNYEGMNELKVKRSLS